MRILVVDHNAVEPLNQSLYRVISESDGTSVRVVIPAAWHDGYGARKGEYARPSDRCEVVPAPVLFSSRTHRLLYRGLERHVSEFSPDVLYVNAEPENFQTYECARIARRHPGTRLVFSTWRNIDYRSEAYPYRLPWLHRSIEKYVLASAAHGIAFNDSAAGIFRAAGFDRMTVIPPEIDTGVFLPAPQSAPRPFTVGYVGRIEKEKGLDILVAAVAGLSPDVRLRIVGSGSSSADVRALVGKSGLAGRTEWTPAKRRGEMPAQYAEMDALVLPSRTGLRWKEQFGRVLIEAMACGVPVIGSDSGEIPRVIGDAGMIVREGDAGALREALTRLIADGQFRKALVGKGLTRVRERHAIGRVAPMYCHLWGAMGDKRAP